MPNVDLILGGDHARKRSVRTEPTQRRSSQRLDALLDAAAEIVDEIGFERLTTQMVAERAGASIGTVYRYFPDRVAVLHALRERSVRRFRARVAELLERTAQSGWWQIVETAIDACIELYRDEPGFSVVHASSREASDDGLEPEFADRLASVIEHDFGRIVEPAELRFRLGVSIELVDALVNRAFTRDPAGDERYLAEAKRVVREYLEAALGEVDAESAAA